jgi:hypothetical protein
MCCFSAPVRSVSGTRIFAASKGDGRQFLAYSMSLAVDSDVAMVLPLPVPPRSAEDAVTFVDLSALPRFFDIIEATFDEPPPNDGSLSLSRSAAPQSKLVVHDVGDFEASFVPAIADFARLDTRFRLPEQVWSTLPQYADWGFAVFKLRKKHVQEAAPRGLLSRIFGGAPKTTFHPMAFDFPRRDPARGLFFPTVHIHDGMVHAKARFDHTLYCELYGGDDKLVGWERSKQSAHGLAPHASWGPFFKKRLKGRLPNEDIVLDFEGAS